MRTLIPSASNNLLLQQEWPLLNRFAIRTTSGFPHSRPEHYAPFWSVRHHVAYLRFSKANRQPFGGSIGAVGRSFSGLFPMRYCLSAVGRLSTTIERSPFMVAKMLEQTVCASCSIGWWVGAVLTHRMSRVTIYIQQATS